MAYLGSTVAAGRNSESVHNAWCFANDGSLWVGSYTVLPNWLTGYNGNSSGVKLPLAQAWSTPSVLTSVCHDANGTLTDAGCPGGGGGGMTYPGDNTIGVANFDNTAWRTPIYGDITALFGSGSCSGYLKSDGTCSTPGGGGTVTDGSGTTTTPEFAESTGTAHVIQYRTASQALGDMGAAPPLTCTTVSSLSPANGGCYQLSTSASTAMPAASSFYIFNVTTESGATATFTGVTLSSDVGCSTYLSGTTLALTGDHAISVKSDGTNVWASCL
jgi:hypothetical protein